MSQILAGMSFPSSLTLLRPLHVLGGWVAGGCFLLIRTLLSPQFNLLSNSLISDPGEEGGFKGLPSHNEKLESREYRYMSFWER